MQETDPPPKRLLQRHLSRDGCRSTANGERHAKRDPSTREALLIRVLGWLLLGLGIAGFAACLYWLAAIRSDPALAAVIAFQPALAVTILGAVAFLMPWLAAGIGLLTGRHWGRPVTMIVCMMLLFLVPVGTLIGIFGFYALYRERRPLLVMRPFAAEEAAREAAEHAAYLADPKMTRTCPHLAPVEAAIRSAGIRVRPHWTKNVEANCLVDLERLHTAFGPLPTVTHGDVREDMRSMDSPRWAQLHCTECGSLIHLARVDAGPDVVRFPPSRTT